MTATISLKEIASRLDNLASDISKYVNAADTQLKHLSSLKYEANEMQKAVKQHTKKAGKPKPAPCCLLEAKTTATKDNLRIVCPKHGGTQWLSKKYWCGKRAVKDCANG